jgi:uncharacterized membrane protein
MRSSCIFALVLSVLLTAKVAGSQTVTPALDEGTLMGTFIDPQGALVNTTTVTIEKRGFSRKLSVVEDGSFKIQLLPGKYQLTAEAVGFHKYRRRVVIASGKTEALRVKLDVVVQKFKKCPPGHLCL